VTDKPDLLHPTWTTVPPAVHDIMVDVRGKYGLVRRLSLFQIVAWPMLRMTRSRGCLVDLFLLSCKMKGKRLRAGALSTELGLRRVCILFEFVSD
jgi:hypothetical protein